MARLSRRQPVPARDQSELAIFAIWILHYGGLTHQADERSNVEFERPTTDPERLAGVRELSRKSDPAYVGGIANQSGEILSGRSMHDQWRELQSLLDHRQHEPTPDPEPAAAAGWSVHWCDGQHRLRIEFAIPGTSAWSSA